MTAPTTVTVPPQTWTPVPGVPIEVWSAAGSIASLSVVGTEIVLGARTSWRIRYVTTSA